jgi:hypothetical protein
VKFLEAEMAAGVHETYPGSFTPVLFFIGFITDWI